MSPTFVGKSRPNVLRSSLSLSRLTNQAPADQEDSAPATATEAPFLANSYAEDWERLESHPPVTILKGVGLSVKAIGDVEGHDGDEVVVHEPSDDEVRYSKVVSRNGVMVGAILIGDVPDTAEIIDAVASGGM